MARRYESVRRPVDYLVSGEWPTGRIVGPIAAEYARAIASVLAGTLSERDLSIYEAARQCSVTRETLARAMAGETYPDLLTLARLETGLGVPIWPVGLHESSAREAQ